MLRAQPATPDQSPDQPSGPLDFLGISQLREISEYYRVADRNPFLMKVVVEQPPPPKDIFEDYAFLGVSNVDGYIFGVIVDKESGEKIEVSNRPKPADKFTVLEIIGGGSPINTQLKLRAQAGGEEGIVSYDADAAAKVRQMTPPAANRTQDQGSVSANVNQRQRALPSPGANPNQAQQQNQQNANQAAPTRRRVVAPKPIPSSQ